MPDKETKWLVVWYDCYEDDDMDDEGSYAVRINGDVLNKIHLDFKYVRFPYMGRTELWKRQSWAGTEIPSSTKTALLSGYQGGGKTIADLPDITKYLVATEISRVERDIRLSKDRLKALSKYKGGTVS